MEKSESSQTNKITIKKAKKKQPINSELDRQKQAEKKKRRLEKALATSAAIISELEKKKQKKKEEELKTLCKEEAHISESVALNVLLGDDQDPNSTRTKKTKINQENQELNPESDRQKQDEKKKRRLEKALATSAAIISELEKKKQIKKEQEQQELSQLDREGAHISESVALNVLLGEDNETGQASLGPVRPVWGGTGGVLFPFVGPVWGGVDFDFEFCPAMAVSSLRIREDGEFNLLQGV